MDLHTFISEGEIMGIKSDRTMTLDFNQQKWDEKFANETARLTPEDIQKEADASYSRNCMDCMESGKKRYKGDFFVVVLSKTEPLSPSICRSSFLHRYSCPTPNYDQIVYHYKKSDDALTELWVIPGRDKCFELKNNALQAQIEKDPLLPHVLNFADGTLDRLMQKLNGEKKFSLELTDEKKEEIRKQGGIFK